MWEKECSFVEKKIWNRPSVKSLIVVKDTQMSTGSVDDGGLTTTNPS